MFSNFENLQSAVMLKLLQRYCCNLYGCTLWKLYRVCDNELSIVWNKAITKVWRLPPTAHTCMLGPLNGKLHILDQLVICFIRFYTRLTTSNSAIVIFIDRVAMSNKQGYHRSNMLYLFTLNGNMVVILLKLILLLHECINFEHQKCQPNAEIVSLICMLK